MDLGAPAGGRPVPAVVFWLCGRRPRSRTRAHGGGAVMRADQSPSQRAAPARDSDEGPRPSQDDSGARPRCAQPSAACSKRGRGPGRAGPRPRPAAESSGRRCGPDRHGPAESPPQEPDQDGCASRHQAHGDASACRFTVTRMRSLHAITIKLAHSRRQPGHVAEFRVTNPSVHSRAHDESSRAQCERRCDARSTEDGPKAACCWMEERAPMPLAWRWRAPFKTRPTSQRCPTLAPCITPKPGPRRAGSSVCPGRAGLGQGARSGPLGPQEWALSL